MFKNFMFAAFALAVSVLGATAANACTDDQNYLCARTDFLASNTPTQVIDGSGNVVNGSVRYDPSFGNAMVMTATGDLQFWVPPNQLSCDPMNGGCVDWTMTWHSNTAGKGATEAMLGLNSGWNVYKGNPLQGGTALWGAGTLNFCSAHGNASYIMPYGNAVRLNCVDGTSEWVSAM